MALFRLDSGASLGELRGGLREDPVARGVEPEVEVDRPDERLEARREERDAGPAVAARFALAEPERLAELDPARRSGPGPGH